MCELPTCVTEARPAARKRHKCCECGGLILEGEQYVRGRRWCKIKMFEGLLYAVEES